jgi:hypothetical protein
MFSMKLACFGEKRAAPTSSPWHPAASSNSPALRPSAFESSGFLKVEPNVLMPDGWVALRRARISSSTRLMASVSPGWSANDARATISPGRRFERLYSNPSFSGGRLSVPSRVDTSTHSSTCWSWPP